MLRRLTILGLIASLMVNLGMTPALARGMSLIRDAEIEATLRDLSDPIFAAARLDPQSIRIFIVNDPQLNAFVAGGMNLFLNTGLIMRSANPGQLMGVIAHETGHIAGGHLSRFSSARQDAATKATIGAILGAAAAVLGGAGAGAAVAGLGQEVAQQGLLKFNRGQEQSADQAALKYLDGIGVGGEGLAEFFQTLEGQSVLASRRSPYLQSHPLTRDRIDFVEQHVARTNLRNTAVSPDMSRRHARMVVKLDAYLNDPNRSLERYRDGDDIPSRMGRAIAHYRIPSLPAAVEEIDGLIADYPDDPYFHELKGQFLFENGRLEEAVDSYRVASMLRPGSALIRQEFGRALIETGRADANSEAIPLLSEAVRIEPRSASAWRLYGIALGRDGQEGEASLALTEYSLLTGRRDDAQRHIHHAESRITTARDPGWLHLQDLKHALADVQG